MDARNMLNYFAVQYVLHVNREANHVAHRLAKNAINLDTNLYELETTPAYIKYVVLSDCMQLE